MLNSQSLVIRRKWSKRCYCSLFLFILIVDATFLKADPSFFEKRAEGWHWYEAQEPEIRKQESGTSDQKNTPLNPSQLIEKQRKDLETKLHTAIIDPSRENISSYLLAQRALMDQSQRFARAWKRVLFINPNLDETIIHPTDQNARHVYFDLKNAEREKKIKALSQAYGLFFFFKKDCPYCHGFAPIVKAFSRKYGWEVLAITLDGGILPAFPKAKRDNGISKKLNIQHVPALIALNPETQQILPLAYGMISQSEIEERIELLTSLSNPSSNLKSHRGDLK